MYDFVIRTETLYERRTSHDMFLGDNFPGPKLGHLRRHPRVLPRLEPLKLSNQNSSRVNIVALQNLKLELGHTLEVGGHSS